MQFAPFVSDIELPFYTSLASHKINHDKLDDSARKLLGLYEIRRNDALGASCRMQILGNALTNDEVPSGHYRAEGIIKNVNTVEEYKNMDKTAALNRAGRTIWEAITDGTIYSCPSLLSSFYVISFADLKKYKFTYWFAFPALHSNPAWKKAESDGGNGISRLTKEETSSLVDQVQTWRYGVDARQHGFFLAKKVLDIKRPGEQREPEEVGAGAQNASTTQGANMEFKWQVASLSSFEDGFLKGIASEDWYVAFADPSTYPENPGWMLRNLLVLVRHRWRLDKIQVLCYRDTHPRRDEGRSIILNLKLDVPVGAEEATAQSSKVAIPDMPKVTGWERNKDGKLGSKIANLAEYLDPQRLADQSVDLNLKLMKWRIAPDLDLDKIKNTRCLLLGAGTLGSYVARNLLGWGVRKVTFVDNGTVSFSNPVRQPLFNFVDCLEGGAKKAPRAAAALKEIYPGVDATGYSMSVPMAGHPVTNESKTKADFEKLQELVGQHDAIILLMDTRESRWLPTVMGKASRKIVLNAALGFDTFVVMRHGVKNIEHKDRELGCYFCNDVVAPADSIKDQTLDQQCTVTRPGIAAIASALLVELLVSVLQNPLGAAAPASKSQDEDRGDHPLGLVPHQIRGYLSNFQNIMINGRSYDCCSACSDKIVDAYRADGWEFVKKALNEKGYVEDLSGLTEVQKRAEQAVKDMELDEEDEFGEEGEGELL